MTTPNNPPPTEVKVVRVGQELGEVEELWDELLDVGHVALTGRPPGVWDAVKQPVREIKMAALCGSSEHCKTRPVQ